MWQGWRNISLPGAGFTSGVLTRRYVAVLAVAIAAVQPGELNGTSVLRACKLTAGNVASCLRRLLLQISLIFNLPVGSTAVRAARIAVTKLLLKFCLNVIYGSRQSGR